MADHRQRQRQVEEQAAGDQHRHGADGEDQVLPDDPCGAPRQAVRVGQPLHVLGQQRHIGGLKRDLRPGRAHGDADIGAGQRGRVVHAVADEGDLALPARAATSRTLSCGSIPAWISSGFKPELPPMRSATGRRSPVIITMRRDAAVAQRGERLAELARASSPR
jgi:hypothetical protein